MGGMEREKNQRLKWVKMYEACGNAGFTCLRCGICRPTHKKWVNRYKESGEDGLRSQSRRPHNSPRAKVGQVEEGIILQFRRERNLGAKRIQSELVRLHDISLSVTTIYKVLVRNEVKPIVISRKSKRISGINEHCPGNVCSSTHARSARGSINTQP